MEEQIEVLGVYITYKSILSQTEQTVEVVAITEALDKAIEELSKAELNIDKLNIALAELELITLNIKNKQNNEESN